MVGSKTRYHHAGHYSTRITRATKYVAAEERLNAPLLGRLPMRRRQSAWGEHRWKDGKASRERTCKCRTPEVRRAIRLNWPGSTLLLKSEKKKSTCASLQSMSKYIKVIFSIIGKDYVRQARSASMVRGALVSDTSKEGRIGAGKQVAGRRVVGIAGLFAQDSVELEMKYQ